MDWKEGYAGLGHAPRAGVHADEEDRLGAVDELGDVLTVRLPGVAQRVVHAHHRLKAKPTRTGSVRRRLKKKRKTKKRTNGEPGETRWSLRERRRASIIDRSVGVRWPRRGRPATSRRRSAATETSTPRRTSCFDKNWKDEWNYPPVWSCRGSGFFRILKYLCSIQVSFAVR